MRSFIFSLFLVVCSWSALCQNGGNAVFTVLDLPVSARVAAMGNKMLSIYDSTDVSLSLLNPSMLNKRMHTGIGFNAVDYFSNAFYGHLNYIHHFNKVGTFNFGFQFATYGNTVAYDEAGNELGKVSAGDYVVLVGYGKELIDSTFSIGMNLKTVFSSYAGYFSAGFGVDFATSYYNRPKDLALTLLIKNVGAQFNTYDEVREKLPFDLQLAFSQKLKHLPVRYSIVLHSLYKWDMSYDDDADPFAKTDATTGEVIAAGKGKKFFSNFFRHIVFALEIKPIKYFSIQAGFDYNARVEMRTFDKRGIVGFSYGLGVHFYNINVYYGRNHNNLASTPNFFTISTTLKSFIKK